MMERKNGTIVSAKKRKLKEVRKIIYERIYNLDRQQAERFAKLNGQPLLIAVEGIARHMQACRKMDVGYDPAAVREIIDDALQHRRVFAMNV